MISTPTNIVVMTPISFLGKYIYIEPLINTYYIYDFVSYNAAVTLFGNKDEAEIPIVSMKPRSKVQRQITTTKYRCQRQYDDGSLNQSIY